MITPWDYVCFLFVIIITIAVLMLVVEDMQGVSLANGISQEVHVQLYTACDYK